MKNILLAEDDFEIVDLLRLHLKEPLFTLQALSNGSEALMLGSETHFDLIILDISLPGISGIDICKKLRGLNILTPIMMLTARAEEIDKVMALELGADDYLTKPFGIAELMARIRALLRRAEQQPINHTAEIVSEINFRNLLISRDARKVTLNNVRLELTMKEFDLLYLLASHPGKSFSRKELLELVWGYTISGYEHTVTSHINRLRLKIEPDLKSFQYIHTSWGLGYRFSE